jgi:hypothetical protein
MSQRFGRHVFVSSGEGNEGSSILYVTCADGKVLLRKLHDKCGHTAPEMFVWLIVNISVAF